MSNEQGKLCPVCKHDIGLWALVKAPIPGRIQCPNCKAGLSYDNSGWGLILIFIVMCLPVISIVASNLTSLYSQGFLKLLLVVLLICLAIGLPLEILLALFLRKNQKLKVR